MKNTVHSFSLPVLLATVFLSAGAFTHTAATSRPLEQTTPMTAKSNVTVISKTSQFPLPGHITTGTCGQTRCFAI